MSRTFEEIAAIVTARRAADAEALRRMAEVRDRYNGDVVVPLADVSGEPVESWPAPALLASAIDNLAMRAASVDPMVRAPAVDDSKERGPASREWARVRRRAWHAVWHANSLVEVKLRRAYRHWFGYGTFAMVARPGDPDAAGSPGPVVIEVRDPLTAYPEPRAADDLREPSDVAFVTGRSAAWIAANYPQAADAVRGWEARAVGGGLWDVVEWMDADDWVVGVLGPRGGTTVVGSGFSGPMELVRMPNRAGRCTAVVPRRVTLDRIAGQVAAAVGTYDKLGRLMALEVVAAERAVFPDMVVLGRPGTQPRLVHGRWRDGREGEPNIVLDAEEVRLLQAAPGPLTMPTIDRLEYAVRSAVGDSPFFSGQTYGALRTGRAITSLADFSIDPRVAEAQRVVARSLAELNRAVAAVLKGWYPTRRFTMFSGLPRDTSQVTFRPATHFETDDNVVEYPLAGADVQSATVGVGQLVGARLMSRRSAREAHPWIADPDHEEAAIAEEELEASVLSGVLAQGQAGSLPLVDQARILQLVREGRPIEEAVLTADREARERQARQAPPPPEGFATAPEAAPGLAAPGQGAESAPARPPDRLAQLRAVLQTLRTGAPVGAP